ncbi:hypothetical protein ACWEV3_12460 [Saccharopolyspora sp. NPDC003752]
MFGLEFGSTFGFTAGLSVFTVDLVGLWGTPVATAHAVSPWDVFRSDRRRALVGGLATGPTFGLAAGITGAFVVGFANVLVVELTSPTLNLTVVQMIWRLCGQQVRFLPLLQAALRRQILRQAGTVYQFRHAALQDFVQSRRSADRPADVTDTQIPDSPTRADASAPVTERPCTNQGEQAV